MPGLGRTLAVVSALFFVTSCTSPTAPMVPGGAIRVNGTVQYVTLEGGFWAIRGEDGVTYDPINGLDAQFQRNNLPVTLVGKVRNDMGSVHMVGPIVEVISIEVR